MNGKFEKIPTFSIKQGNWYCRFRVGSILFLLSCSIKNGAWPVLVSVELFPFRGEPEVPNRELLELATNEGIKGLFIECSFAPDVMDHFMRVSTIHFVSTNLVNCFDQIGVSVRVLKRSNGSRIRSSWAS